MTQQAKQAKQAKQANKYYPYLAFLLQIPEKYFFSTNWTILKRPSCQPAGRRNRNGYTRIPFRFHGCRYDLMEHILIWIYKHKRLPIRQGKLLQINHKDLCRNNNHPDNLELTTQSENIRHRIAERKKRTQA